MSVVIEQFIQFCDEMEIATEDKNNSESGKPKQFIRLLKHLLKYQFQMSEQSKSWITSICDSRYKVSISKTSIKNDLIENFEKYYKIALTQAFSETKQDKGSIPGDIPWGWTFENITSKDWIYDYLISFLYSEEAKDFISKENFKKLNKLE